MFQKTYIKSETFQIVLCDYYAIHKQEVEGVVDQATGETKKVADKAKDKVENVVEDVKEKLDK